MIPNRAPAMTKKCLTMFGYQEMPLIPSNRNCYTEKVVKAQVDLPQGEKIQAVKKNRNPGRKKGMTKEQIGEFHRAAAIVKNKAEIARIFANGPITVNELHKHFGFKSRGSANVRMNSWLKMGLVKLTGEVRKIMANSGNGEYLRDNKLWEAVK